MKHILILILTALLLAPLAARPADTKPATAKAPFRVLYIDDTTRTRVAYAKAFPPAALPNEEVRLVDAG